MNKREGKLVLHFILTVSKQPEMLYDVRWKRVKEKMKIYGAINFDRALEQKDQIKKCVLSFEK